MLLVQAELLAAGEQRVLHAGAAGLVGAGADPHAAAADEQADDQPEQGGAGEHADAPLARVVVDVQADVAADAVEADGALALGQLVRLARAEHDAAVLVGAAVELGEGCGVQHVHVLRAAGVQAEVPVVRVQLQLRVEQLGVRGERGAFLVLHRRGQEEADEAQLVRPRVGDLDGGLRAVVLVEHAGDHGALEGHVPGAVADGHHGRVAVAHEVDAHAVDVQRLVDLEDLALELAAGALADVHDGGVVQRLAVGGLRLPLEHGVERVEGEGERLEVVRAEVGAGGEGVVGHEVVGEALALHDDLLPAVLGHAAVGHEHEHADQRDVEQDVADLAQVSALGAHGRAAGLGAVLHAVAALAQPRLGSGHGLLGAGAAVLQDHDAGSRQARQVAGVRAGGWRRALACWMARGHTQPTRETNSSR